MTCHMLSPVVFAGVTAVVCDALNLKGVESALDGCDAAITTLGGAPGGDEEKRVDYVGNRNVIESAGILGITRVIVVSSIGCGSSRKAINDETYKVIIVKRVITGARALCSASRNFITSILKLGRCDSARY